MVKDDQYGQRSAKIVKFVGARHDRKTEVNINGCGRDMILSRNISSSHGLNIYWLPRK